MKILVLGDALLDKNVFGAVNRQSPEDPTVSILDFVTEEYRLGGSLNVAANLRSLSKTKDEIYVSSILSYFTANILKEKKIQYDSTIFDIENEPHTRELVKTRFLRSDSHKQLLRLDNRLKFSEGDIQRYKNKCYYYNAKEFDAVVVSDYNKGLIDDFILSHLKNVKCPIFVDTKKPDISIWNELDNVIIKVNKKESECLIGTTKHKLIVTLGKRGCEIRYPNNSEIVKYPTKEVLNGDVVGAGDVFLAGFVVKFMETGGNIDDSVAFANKAANKSVQKFGTCEVKRSEIT